MSDTLIDSLLTDQNIDSVRRTFTSTHGKTTLDIILVLGNFLNPDISDPQDVGKRNLCIDLLRFFGPVEPERSNEMVCAITDALCALPIRKFKPNQEGEQKDE